MTIMVTKVKTKEILKDKEMKLEESQDLKGLTDEELADVYGQLSEKSEVILKEFKENPTILAFEAINKELLARLKEELEPTDTAALVGKTYELDISACSKSPRKLDTKKMADLEKALGRELFLKLVKLTMKDLETYLGKAVIDKFIDQEVTYTDTRKIVVKTIS